MNPEHDAYYSACAAVLEFAAMFGADCATFSPSIGGYVVLHFRDKTAKMAFVSRPDAEVEAWSDLNAHWLRTSIKIGKTDICVIEQVYKNE